MGYRHQIPRVNVAFEPGHEYHGCEVVLRKLTLGEYLDIVGLSSDASIANVGDQLKQMGNKLISWNLEAEDGTPIPADPGAVLDQDKDLMIAILNAWLEGISSVSAPLEPSSTGGEPSLEASIPMDVPSESLAS